MKRIISLILLIFPAILYSQKIAVMEFKPGVGVSVNDVDGLSSIFNTYFNPEGYTLVERSQIDKVIDEQSFQRSSLTESQMVRIGEILNLSKIVVGNINIIMGEYNVDVRVINIETGTIAAKDGASFTQGSYRENMKTLATSLANQIEVKQTSLSENKPPQNISKTKKISKAELIRRGFKFSDSFPFVDMDGQNGKQKIQFVSAKGSCSENNIETICQNSWYQGGEIIDGKLNGLIIMTIPDHDCYNISGRTYYPSDYIGYVCDGELAFPLLGINRAYYNTNSPHTRYFLVPVTPSNQFLTGMFFCIPNQQGSLSGERWVPDKQRALEIVLDIIHVNGDNVISGRYDIQELENWFISFLENRSEWYIPASIM